MLEGAPGVTVDQEQRLDELGQRLSVLNEDLLDELVYFVVVYFVAAYFVVVCFNGVDTLVGVDLAAHEQHHHPQTITLSFEDLRSQVGRLAVRVDRLVVREIQLLRGHVSKLVDQPLLQIVTAIQHDRHSFLLQHSYLLATYVSVQYILLLKVQQN